MYRYYQTTLNQRGAWKICEDGQVPDDAYHVTVLARSVPVEEQPDETQVLWRGDFPIDIDAPSIEEAISYLKQLLGYIGEGFPIRFLRIYASGKKGFHVFVPWKAMFPSNRGRKGLPAVYRGIADSLIRKLGLPPSALDTSLYSSSRGHVLRIENKRREEGVYKVPITETEALEMTPEKYRELVSQPRDEVVFEEPSTIFAFWSGLIKEAQKTTEEAALGALVLSVPDEAFVGLDGHPNCIERIMSFDGVKGEEGFFNRAGMVITFYQAQKKIPKAESRAMLRQMVDSASNARRSARTDQQRLDDLLGKWAFAENNKDAKFSCRSACSIFTDVTGMCNGCPVAKHAVDEIVRRHGVFEEDGKYRRVKGGEPFDISTFLFKDPVIIRPDPEHAWKQGDVEGMAFKVVVALSPRDPRHLTLPVGWSTSLREFKKLIEKVQGATFKGTEDDLNHLKAYLDEKHMNDESAKRSVIAVGINRYKHKGEDGKVVEQKGWVEPAYSYLDDRTSNILKLEGGNVPNLGPTHYQMEVDPGKPDPASEEGLELLLNSAMPHVVGFMQGWVCVCHLKEHIFPKHKKEFPLLHIAGSSGAGKTATARVHAITGGADYITIPPEMAENATPHPFLVTGVESNTIPRIFDEVNPTRFARNSAWMACKSVLKAASTGSTIKKGARDSRYNARGGFMSVEYRVTSPIMYLATTPNSDAELQQRSIILELSEDMQRGYQESYERLLEDDRLHEGLWKLSKTLVKKALSMTDKEAAQLYDAEGAAVPDYLKGRNLVGYRYIPTGLEFLAITLEEYGYKPELAVKVRECKAAMLEFLVTGERLLSKQKSKTEIMTVLEDLANLASGGELSEGEHYCRFGNTLYLQAPYCWIMFDRLMSPRRMREYQRGADFRTALTKQPFFLKEVPGKGNKGTWSVMDLNKLAEMGCELDGFKNSSGTSPN